MTDLTLTRHDGQGTVTCLENPGHPGDQTAFTDRDPCPTVCFFAMASSPTTNNIPLNLYFCRKSLSKKIKNNNRRSRNKNLYFNLSRRQQAQQAALTTGTIRAYSDLWPHFIFTCYPKKIRVVYLRCKMFSSLISPPTHPNTSTACPYLFP